jgi:hypothetical protein
VKSNSHCCILGYVTNSLILFILYFLSLNKQHEQISQPESTHFRELWILFAESVKRECYHKEHRNLRLQVFNMAVLLFCRIIHPTFLMSQ